jgi:hypothetical protein
VVVTLKHGATKDSIDQLSWKIAKQVRLQGVNTRKYCGKIELKEDSLKIQKRLRGEWE